MFASSALPTGQVISPSPGAPGSGTQLGTASRLLLMCSSACVDCQAGHTTRLSIRRQAFVSAERLVQQVGQRLAEAAQPDSLVDVITLVPEGEATLDLTIEATLDGLRRSACPSPS